MSGFLESGELPVYVLAVQVDVDLAHVGEVPLYLDATANVD
jgi:hypothetical protein